MLYAISGSSSCGKSTIIQKFDENGHYVIRNQYARELLRLLHWDVKDVYSNKKNLDMFHTSCLGNKQSTERIYSKSNKAQSHKDSIVVTERAFLDIFIYYSLYYEKYYQNSFLNILMTDVSSENNLLTCHCPLTEDETKLFFFFQKCLTLDALYYQNIFYLGASPYIEDDNVRISSVDCINKQKEIFTLVQENIPWYHEHMIIIPEIAVMNRMHSILECMSCQK